LNPPQGDSFPFGYCPQPDIVGMYADRLHPQEEYLATRSEV
jgi:hypothetical protein